MLPSIHSKVVDALNNSEMSRDEKTVVTVSIEIAMRLWGPDLKRLIKDNFGEDALKAFEKEVAIANQEWKQE